MQDQAIFTLSDFLLANCVSSFSAFAVRYRTARDQPVGFWTLLD